MWGIAEVQLKIMTDDQARDRAAARQERSARAAAKSKRDWRPERRAPDAQPQGSRPATA